MGREELKPLLVRLKLPESLLFELVAVMPLQLLCMKKLFVRMAFRIFYSYSYVCELFFSRFSPYGPCYFGRFGAETILFIVTISVAGRSIIS